MIQLRHAAYAVTLSLVSGCYRWEAVTPYVPVSSHVRVTGRGTEILDGRIVGRSSDSLFVDAGGDRRRVAFAVGDIRSIEQHVFSLKRTATVVAGAAVIAGLAVLQRSRHGDPVILNTY